MRLKTKQCFSVCQNELVNILILAFFIALKGVQCVYVTAEMKAAFNSALLTAGVCISLLHREKNQQLEQAVERHVPFSTESNDGHSYISCQRKAYGCDDGCIRTQIS